MATAVVRKYSYCSRKHLKVIRCHDRKHRPVDYVACRKLVWLMNPVQPADDQPPLPVARLLVSPSLDQSDSTLRLPALPGSKITCGMPIAGGMKTHENSARPFTKNVALHTLTFEAALALRSFLRSIASGSLTRCAAVLRALFRFSISSPSQHPIEQVSQHLQEPSLKCAPCTAVS
jgi:hypothetical protein